MALHSPLLLPHKAPSSQVVVSPRAGSGQAGSQCDGHCSIHGCGTHRPDQQVPAASPCPSHRIPALPCPSELGRVVLVTVQPKLHLLWVQLITSLLASVLVTTLFWYSRSAVWDDSSRKLVGAGASWGPRALWASVSHSADPLVKHDHDLVGCGGQQMCPRCTGQLEHQQPLSGPTRAYLSSGT